MVAAIGAIGDFDPEFAAATTTEAARLPALASAAGTAPASGSEVEGVATIRARIGSAAVVLEAAGCRRSGCRSGRVG